MKIPLTLVKGDSATWKDSSKLDANNRLLASPDWVLKYAIRGAVSLDLTASPDGSGWSTEVTAVQSATLTAGTYYWQAFVEKGAERCTVGQGRLTVLPQLSAESGTYDGRSQARKDLEAVQAAMRSMVAGGAVQAYTIGNRQLQRMQMSDLIMLERNLKYAVSQEEKQQKIANGEGNPDTLLVRFK